MGSLFHLKSRPGCLEELGISPLSNWAELLGLPTLSSSATASLPINEHPIHVQPDLKLAAKHPVKYMWKEEDHRQYAKKAYRYIHQMYLAILTGWSYQNY
jgi:hypothetical protein